MGCKSNQFESAVISETLENNGWEKSNSPENCDIFILNSCTVTHKSDNEALYILRNIKHKNHNVKTILTGCLAQVEKENLLKNDFVDVVLGNNEKLDILKYLDISGNFEVEDLMTKEEFTPASLHNTSKTRANVKIQDGCDNRCAYCIIPFARGKSRSAKSDFIINQINELVNNGFKEVVFTGIHIGQWGKEWGLSLLDLLKEVEEKTSVKRYRLGSLNPLEITDELLNFLQKSDKFCPHFHLSLQSACDRTLKNMNRFYKVDDYLKQIEKINQMFELPFLGSDIITGFAGETDEDFEITAENLKKSGLSKIHTFPYSRRKGTVGYNAPSQVEDSVKEKRADVVKDISKIKYDKFVSENIGKIAEVLIQKHPDKSGKLKGITRNYLTIILDCDDLKLSNTIVNVKITEYKDGKIYGKIM